LTLVVYGRFDAQANAWTVGDELNRNQEASVEREAVRRDQIHFLRRVGTAAEAFWCPSRADAENRQDAATQVHPLALNAQQFRPQVEDQVVSLISKWSKDSHSELDGLRGDAGFRDCSLLVRCHMRQPVDRIGWAVSV
jgi:hypothetical protein